jgi:hypothetical protein
MVLLVSIFSTSQIMVNSLVLLPTQGSKKSTLASSPVLDYLLPELSVWQTGEIKQKQPLENIDTYMLQETKLNKECVAI